MKGYFYVALFLMCGSAALKMGTIDFGRSYISKAMDILNNFLRDTEEYIPMYLRGNFISKYL